MTQQELPKHDDLQTGHDLPNADGQVADEDIGGRSGKEKRVKGGKDYSLDDYRETMPDGGVGGVQDNSDTTSDIYREKN